MADIKFDFGSEGDVLSITFPTGTATANVFEQSIVGEGTTYVASTVFTSSLSGSYSSVSINDINLTNSFSTVYQTESSSVRQTVKYLYCAKLEGGVVTLRQDVSWSSTTSPVGSTISLTGRAYSTTAVAGSGVETVNFVRNGTTTSLMVLKYATTGSNLQEATRSGISTYSKANLDSYVGLKNDTWSGITNASSLVAGNYYYIRVNVSDTNKTGKFCVRFISANGTTITTDNMGWGYDGEPIYTQNVWVKPYPYAQTVGSNTTITTKKTSSPYRDVGVSDTIQSGDIIYYGDMFNITATPSSGYTLTKFTINESSQVTSSTTAVTKSWRCTGPITVVTEATKRTLSAPVINCTATKVTSGSSATITYWIHVANNNNVAVKLSLEATMTDTGTITRSYAKDIVSNSYTSWTDTDVSDDPEYWSMRLEGYFTDSTGLKSNTTVLRNITATEETTTTTE